jgi:ubiquinone/menaquinone biosynthesis C-methylase UbiE
VSPSITDYLRYAWQMLNGYRANKEKKQATRRWDDLLPYLDSNRPQRILDLANGRLRPQYLLEKSVGHQVYGIDLANYPQLNWKGVGYRVARWNYSRQVGVPAYAATDQRLVCGDVSILPFQDDYFDLAVSANAFEHFLDVPSVVAELHRVLRPGGFVWVSIHLFTCLSGGHNLSFT